MNANSNVPDKVTIKVKLCDEDYHDIVLDWSDKSCEYKQQLFMRKLASYTRVPIEYFTNVIFYLPGYTASIFRNQETKFRTNMMDPVENETFMSFFSDGDCFCLSPIFIWSDQDKSFEVKFELASSDRVNVSQCDWFWCQYRNTRALMDRRIRILKSSELVAKLNAASERRHVDNSAEFRKIFADFDITQAMSDVLGCRDENDPDEYIPEYRSYPSYRG